ncbi:MAG TPA: NADH-quinone oxidoreductase subunit J [Nitrosomonas nitrosa]|jgi:NADH-quinone oxidoreductase subunit J|uniref:NADH-quinone oxidoreductase subunit J n=2 Tax=Nitrosomonas nitrosa TaxID=52442 RepID=A0A8H8YYP7_9PROT|nr:NADH-quinone oxidoreductase subunit J [Nitrosomonas nitrosa]MCO6433753.1 NADH-quinone oxidoreductase subunit J [Nitrosomonas nitrosa]CAE6486021.1 NADH-quinone oxidoreductase subunit J [Nitrosomonas nitrosa]HNP50949.1 NADH-quinone oxidoreductase subunit J [Nitrosomonas nitrosa]
MIFQDFIFYTFSGILIMSALGVITLRNPVYAALLLVLAFFTSAGIWLLLEAEFLAITLVLVYVGAVMVLFLFVVMMLDINLERLREGFWKWFPFGALLAIVLAIQMSMVLMGKQFNLENMPVPAPHEAGYSNTKELGRLIYTEYVYAFELAAVILLVAMVAAIALTLRHRTDKKSPNPSKQIAVKRSDRIRIIPMPPENKE